MFCLFPEIGVLHELHQSANSRHELDRPVDGQQGQIGDPDRQARSGHAFDRAHEAAGISCAEDRQAGQDGQ